MEHSSIAWAAFPSAGHSEGRRRESKEFKIIVIVALASASEWGLDGVFEGAARP
jgi:hypothetical protein